MVRKFEDEKVAKFQTRCGKAIELYLKQKSKGSENTERNYRSRINRFLKHMFSNKDINTITSEELDLLDFESFEQYVDSFKNVKNTTINNHISAIKAMYRHLKSRSIIECDISYFEEIDSLNNDSIEIDPMPIEVVKRYIEEAGREKFNPEVKQKLIKLAADQGLRMDELLNLSWGSFVPREDGVVVNGYGKGNKKFTKKINYKVYEDLLTLRKGNSLDSKVFAPLSDKNVTDMMIRFREVLGYEDMQYSFHSLRKSAVTYFHRTNGGDLLLTQRFAGHSSPNTTQLYVGADELGVTGMFSTENLDKEAYTKVSHEKLLEALKEMNYGFIHALNSKLMQNEK